MTFGKWILIAGVLVTVAVIAVVVYMDMAPRPHKVQRTTPNEITLEFMQVLPEDVTEPLRQEIEGLLYTFFARAEQGQVKIDDRIDIDNKLRAHVDRGEIERSDLARLMAEVSFYTYRLDPEINPPDSSGMHPLLIDNTSEPN